jgi:hypothetical protein
MHEEWGDEALAGQYRHGRRRLSPRRSLYIMLASSSLSRMLSRNMKFSCGKRLFIGKGWRIFVRPPSSKPDLN